MFKCLFHLYSDLSIIKQVLDSASILNSKWKVKAHVFVYFNLTYFFNKCRFLFYFNATLLLLWQRQEELVYILTYDILFGQVSFPSFFIELVL